MFFISCKRESVERFTKNSKYLNPLDLLYIDSTPVNGVLRIVAYNRNQPDLGTPSVSFDAFGLFTQNSTVLHELSDGLNAGNVTIGSATLDYQLFGENNYLLDLAERSNQSFTSLFGDTTTFSVGGNPGIYGSGSLDLECPEIVVISNPFNSSSKTLQSHSKGSNLDLEWNSGNDDVVILLQYDGPLSSTLDSLLSDTSQFVDYLTADDGVYTINSSVFSAYPVGGICRVFIARGSWDDLTLDDTKVINVGCFSVTSVEFQLTN